MPLTLAWRAGLPPRERYRRWSETNIIYIYLSISLSLCIYVCVCIYIYIYHNITLHIQITHISNPVGQQNTRSKASTQRTWGQYMFCGIFSDCTLWIWRTGITVCYLSLKNQCFNVPTCSLPRSSRGPVSWVPPYFVCSTLKQHISPEAGPTNDLVACRSVTHISYNLWSRHLNM